MTKILIMTIQENLGCLLHVGIKILLSQPAATLDFNLLHAVKQPTANFGYSLFFVFPLLQAAVWRWIKNDYSLAELTTG